MSLKDYQKEFISFLIDAGVLTFGDFTTKSGRKTPYFLNAGNFDSGFKIEKLGKFYARHILASKISDIDIIFGPAYKGIPLSVTTAIALSEELGRDIGFCFDRKEVKDHGEGGSYVGRVPEEGSKIVIVEDVITAGTTMREVVPPLRNNLKVDLKGVILTADRCERGTGELSAKQEAENDHDLKIYPLVSVYEIIEYLSSDNSSGFVLSEEQQTAMSNYLETYGVPL